MSFTFTSHPVTSILNHHFELFSDAKKVIGAYYCPKSKLYFYKEAPKQIDFMISEEFKQIKLLHSPKTTFSWYDEKELPFHNSKKVFQEEIFSELDKTVLLLRIPQEIANYPIWFFIYYDKNLSNYGLSISKDLKLNTEVKNIIGKTCYNSVCSILKNTYRNSQILSKEVNPITQNIIKENLSLKSENNQLKRDNAFKNIVESLFKSHLKAKQIKINSLSLDKLSKFSHDFEQLAEIIKKGSDYLKIIYNNSIPESIEIEEFLIPTPDASALKNDNITFSDKRLKKTQDTLDNLESAISEVLRKQLTPNGTNVGKAMNKPISAPAISDFLKKHRERILILFDEQPEKWKYLRNYFRPVQNLSSQTPLKRNVS